jgi:molybdopterin-guanine dinucleotide biosynthesis protein A
MGRDKATLPLDRAGGAALGRLVLAAAARVADPVVLVAPVGHVAAALAGEAGVALVPDPGEGPLPALAAALEAVDAPYLLLLAADHPGLRIALLQQLVTRAVQRGAPAVACRVGPGGRATQPRGPDPGTPGFGRPSGKPPMEHGLEPLVAVYRRGLALAAARERLRGGPDRSLRGLLGSLHPDVLEEHEWRALDPDGSSFVDLDDPADLAAWQAGGKP